MNPLITNETLPNTILQMEGKLSLHYHRVLIDFVNSEVTTVVGKARLNTKSLERHYQYQT